MSAWHADSQERHGHPLFVNVPRPLSSKYSSTTVLPLNVACDTVPGFGIFPIGLKVHVSPLHGVKVYCTRAGPMVSCRLPSGIGTTVASPKYGLA